MRGVFFVLCRLCVVFYYYFYNILFCGLGLLCSLGV